jgi:hypothetical protein
MTASQKSGKCPARAVDLGPIDYSGSHGRSGLPNHGELRHPGACWLARHWVSLADGGNSVCALLSSVWVECRGPRLERILDKTGARHRAEPVRYAIQAGIEPVALTA